MKISVSGKKLLIILVITLAITIGIAFARGLVHAQGRDVLRCLSDAFFVGGALTTLVGGLLWCADNGVADGFTYGASRLFRRRGAHYEENKETFSEYRERKHAKKIRISEFLICGGAFLLLSVLVLIPYWV